VNKIERIIRNDILHNLRNYKKADAKSDSDWILTDKAIKRRGLFILVEEGLISYIEAGVPSYRGITPYQIWQEHTIIRNITQQAKAEKRQIDGR
jgi:hypothetical protein